MIKRVLLGVVAISALAAAVAVAVVASAFALYAALRDPVGPPGAAAIVAATAALLVALAGLAAGLRARRSGAEEEGLIDRLVQMGRDRPFLAAGAALAAGLIALKNPKLAAGLASAFMAKKATEKPDRRRR